MSEQNSCYMCDRPANSREHVPPLCFFPERKDIPEKDYRVNLITVPSCEDHNSRKSEDDFYVLFVICSSLSSKSVAKKQFSTKIIRALNKRPQMQSFYSRNIPVSIDSEESMVYEVNRERFDRVMAHVACGLYFHMFGEKWQHDVIIHTANLINVGALEPLDYQKKQVELEDLFADFLIDVAFYGENPDIFQYKINRFKNDSVFMIGMLFYQGFGAFAYGSINSIT